ncbi:hypothetical protein N2152v2_010774 [Parachlorella kessleri]
MHNSKPEPDPLAGHAGFETVRRLTDAQYGFVVLARDKATQELVAIRWFDNRLHRRDTRQDAQWIPLEDKDCIQRIAEQMRLVHPCLLDVRQALACPPYFGLVMECAPDGDAMEYVQQQGGLPEGEARWFFQQIVLAMDYLHAQGASCKDLRLEHAFLARQPGSPWPRLKLRHFDYTGLLQDLQDQFPHSRMGDYLAPEAITQLEGGGKPADAWAAGAMLYTLLYGHHPFERPGDKSLPFASRADYRLPDSPAISDACHDLLTRLLEKAPAKRLSIKGVMEHPWFKQDLPAELLRQHQEALRRDHTPVQAEEQLRGIIDQVVAANARSAGVHHA